jgi:hypothetical protein
MTTWVAETRWWPYYNKSTSVKLSCICLSLIYFTVLGHSENNTINITHLIDSYYGIPQIIMNYGPRVNISAGWSTERGVSAGYVNGDGTDHWPINLQDEVGCITTLQLRLGYTAPDDTASPIKWNLTKRLIKKPFHPSAAVCECDD